MVGALTKINDQFSYVASVALQKYTIQRTSDLLTALTNFLTGIEATPGTNYVRDATATGPGPFFYRIRVE